jgi:ABC-type antimicrobial peptide transport system permease subunit
MTALKKQNQKTIMIGLAAALIFVVLGIFVFSYALETLDVKAEELGAEEQPIWSAPFADYTVAGSDSQWIALAVGVAATLLIFAVALGAAKAIKKKKVTQQ